MGTHVTSPPSEELRGEAPPNREAHSSGVSWGAVIGGAFVASSCYLILLALGAGFGLLAISPWSNAGITAETAGTVALIWLVIVEIVSSAFGGYLAGRLRTKWTLIHNDEVFFRDTANGFLSWAVALVVGVAFLASAATSMTGSAVRTRAQTEGGSTIAAADANSYFVDTLFRSDRGSDAADVAVKAEAGRILMNGLRQNEIPPADRTYLAKIVSARTGLSPEDADKRLSDVMNDARQAEDALRKATARFLLWLFVSLLAGAFSASYAATVGGRQRDHVKPV